MAASASADFGFSRAERLCKTDEFSSVFAFRRALKGQYFMLHYRTGSVSGPRLGVVVAKKLARRAVLRNLVKRIMREEFRLHRAELPPCDLILRLAAPVTTVTRAQMHADILSLFQRLPR